MSGKNETCGEWEETVISCGKTIDTSSNTLLERHCNVDNPNFIYSKNISTVCIGTEEPLNLPPVPPLLSKCIIEEIQRLIDIRQKSLTKEEVASAKKYCSDFDIKNIN